MGRSPCCDEVGVKKGPWTPEEDEKLVDYIESHGHRSWRNLPKSAGLNRCGKSCRLRWTNYLRPDIKRGMFTEEEEQLIVHLHSILGNKWSAIAGRLPGRTDNEIKNYWNTHLKKKLLRMGIDPVTHRRRTDLDILLSIANNIPWDDALRLQAEAAHLAKLQLFHSLIQTTSTNSNLQMNPELEAVLSGSLNLTPSSVTILDAIDGHEDGCPDQMNNIYYGNPTSSLVSASPENVTGNQMPEPINSNDVSVNSSALSPFEAWEGLNPGTDDLYWKDILDQMAWSNGQ